MRRKRRRSCLCEMLRGLRLTKVRLSIIRLRRLRVGLLSCGHLGMMWMGRRKLCSLVLCLRRKGLRCVRWRYSLWHVLRGRVL